MTKPARGQRGSRRRRAFTLIEMMVAIVIIAILISIILLVSSNLVGEQKQRSTRLLMDSVLLAVEDFAATNPMANRYDRPNAASFGPYPPVHADFPDGDFDDDEVADIVEPNPPCYTTCALLKKRLGRDLFGDADLDDEDLISVREDDDLNLDNRLLYTYLALYASEALGQIPDKYKQPLPIDAGDPGPVETGEEFVNLGDEDDPASRTPILGLVDAWGVPLDYLLYAKLERKYDPTAGGQKWVVVDRKPVLRSRGVSKEIYEAGGDSPKTWIWSEPLPSPQADIDEDGAIDNPSASDSGGWVRLKGFEEDYGWLPEHDPKPDEE